MIFLSKKLKFTIVFLPFFTFFSQLLQANPFPTKDINCPHCHWSLPQTTNEAAVPPDLLCENLYQAACIVADGSQKDRDRAKEIESSLKATVEEARQKTYTQLGLQNTEHALTHLFSKNGIALVENLSDKAKKNLFENDLSSYVSAKELYLTVAQCKKTRESFPTSAPNEIEQVRQKITEIESFLNIYQFQRNQLLARNLPALVQILNDKCRSLKNRTPSEVEQNEELQPLSMFCEQRDPARQAVLDLERRRNNKDNFEEQALQLVTQFTPLLNLNEHSSAPAQTTSSTTRDQFNDNLEALKYRYHFLHRHSDSVCDGIAIEIGGRAKRLRKDFLKIISRSRSTVEFLISQHYDDAKKQLATTLFERGRLEMVQLLGRIIPNPLVRSRIEEQYSKLELAWLNPPQDSEYEKHSTYNIEVLKESMQVSISAISSAFDDEDLSFFTTMNATYMTAHQFGVFQTAATVTMMPSFLQMLQRNPYGFMTVLSHEMGHNIGPRLSIVNGNDLREVHRPMTSCLAQSNSIGMTVDQGDESIADAIAAEILSKLIAQMPESLRTRAILAGVEPFCAIADASREGSIDLRRVHPEGIYRVGGIFGANPGIRNLLKCKTESRTYRTCSWDK